MNTLPKELEGEFEISRNEGAVGDISGLLKHMFVEKGSKEDWDLLSALHYKGENLPAGPRFWKITLHGETIGILIVSSPKLMIKERNVLFPAMKPRGMTHESAAFNKQRAHWMNDNFTVVSRFVVDTMYRGCGIAYRAQNLISRMYGMKYTEIQSSMCKYNTFAEKAGFKFVKPMKSNKFDAGMNFIRQYFHSNPVDHEALMAELERMPQDVREKFEVEIREWYMKNSALESVGNNAKFSGDRALSRPIGTVLKDFQQMAFASPMYGIYKNPDLGRDLPERLPLTAFDTQKPNERLDDRWLV